MCGGWDLKHVLYYDHSKISSSDVMAENTRLKLRHILESSSDSIASAMENEAVIDGKNLKKVQQAYMACLDESQIELTKSDPLLHILCEIDAVFPTQRPHGPYGSFPKMMHTMQKGFSYTGENELSNVLAYLMSIGVDAVISFSVEVTSRMALTKSQI